ncbi:MAG TPA: TROVE domain-containing protein [Bacteroidetes bacterium]|nr:TROVE domain-containing protein [Bacteroidota bacterium]
MRFNILARRNKTVRNHEGEKSWTLCPELELYTAVVTTSLDKKFYESAKERVTRIRTLVSQCDATFVAKLAVYAREKMYLRSIPLVLVVELAKVHQGDSLVSKLVNRVVKRADEITELLAYYQAANERQGVKKLGGMSKQLQKGLALAFNKFDEYQFAKYNRATEVKLRDALFLIHPRPKDVDQQALFDKIASDSLAVPETWEVKMTQFGQANYASAAKKKAARTAEWEAMIESGKMGYMAMLRNLRNFLEADISDAHLMRVTDRLGDAAQVAQAKQLPFRFLSAFRELKHTASMQTPLVLEALEVAIQASVANLKGFDRNTKVLVAADVSGSMYVPVSAKSKIQMYDIGLLMGMLLQHKCARVITSIFGSDFKVKNLPRTNILQNTHSLQSMCGEVGYGTNGYKVINYLIKQKMKLDKVMIFTDMQLWSSEGKENHLSKSWAAYKKIAPQARLYIFDLAGYGQTPIDVKQSDVSLIAGWSEKVFEILEAIENGGDALAEINKIEV